MPNIEQQLNEIKLHYKNEELVKKTAEQIQKDFQIIGEEISYSGNYIRAYEELYNQLYTIVDYYVNKKFEQFLLLLYRIDIDENIIKNLLHDNSKNFIEESTQLIIEREFKKVMIRQYYSVKNNSSEI